MAMRLFFVVVNSVDYIRVQLDAEPDVDIVQSRCKVDFIGEYCRVYDALLLDPKQTDLIANVQDESGSPIGTPQQVINYLSKQKVNIMLPVPVSILTIEEKLPFASVEASLSRPLQSTIALMNQTTTFENYLSLTVTPESTDVYRFEGSYTWSVNALNQDFLERIQLKEGAPVIRNVKSIRKEGKDTAGTGVVVDTISGGIIGATVDTGTDQVQGRTFVFSQTLTKGLTYTLDVDWAGSSNNIEPTIYEGFLSCMRATNTKL
jgi:hypothetical protein